MKIGLFNETDEDLKEEFKILKKVLKSGLKLLNINKCEFTCLSLIGRQK